MQTQRTHNAFDLALWMGLAGLVFPFLMIALSTPFLHLGPGDTRLSACADVVGESFPSIVYKVPAALCGIFASALALYAHDRFTRPQLLRHVLLFLACNYAVFVLINACIEWHIDSSAFARSLHYPYAEEVFAYLKLYCLNFIQPILAVGLSALIASRFKPPSTASVPRHLGTGIFVSALGCFAFQLLIRNYLYTGYIRGVLSVFLMRPFDIFVSHAFHARDLQFIPILLGATLVTIWHRKRAQATANPLITLAIALLTGYVWLKSALLAGRFATQIVHTWPTPAQWVVFLGAFTLLAAALVWLGYTSAAWAGARFPLETCRDAMKRFRTRLVYLLDDSAH